MGKDLVVLVPLKKTLILYFARLHLYCSLRSLLYGMTTLVPSMNFPVDGFRYLLGFGLLKELLGNGFLVALCRGDPFLLQDIQV